MPQSYLDDLSIAARQRVWEDHVGSYDAGKRLYVALADSRPAGLIAFGGNRDPRKNGCGEIYAIYLVKEQWGRGIGHALFEKAGQALRVQGVTLAYLWVLDSNAAARAAYRRWGGVIEADIVLHGKVGGHDIREVMVTFCL